MRFVWSSGFDGGEVSNAHRHLIDGLPRDRKLPNEVCCGHFCAVFVTVGGDVRELALAFGVAIAWRFLRPDPLFDLVRIKPDKPADEDERQT